jgi:hypothetical protein
VYCAARLIQNLMPVSPLVRASCVISPHMQLRGADCAAGSRLRLRGSYTPCASCEVPDFVLARQVQGVGEARRGRRTPRNAFCFWWCTKCGVFVGIGGGSRRGGSLSGQLKMQGCFTPQRQEVQRSAGWALNFCSGGAVCEELGASACITPQGAPDKHIPSRAGDTFERA